MEGGVGLITLNRPKAINSLTHSMALEMDAALASWASDPAVTAVLVDGAGERGLCAGGDIVPLYHSAQGDGAEGRKFFFDEYRLNARIGAYPKPYVAVMDGLVMGGGVGISAHGSVRIVTDTSKIAMPEVGIGFIPDVGGSFLLSRAPGGLGLHAGLTGAPFGAADAIAMGFADHYIPHTDLPALRAAVIGEGIEAAVTAFAAPPPPGTLVAQRDWIDTCYTGRSVTDILDALRTHPDPAAHAAAELIAGRSPIALSVALAAIRRAATLDSLPQVLVQEYRISCAALRSHDFVEGIRAAVIDKDRTPHWSPATLEAVTAADVDAYFAPADPDLTF